MRPSNPAASSERVVPQGADMPAARRTEPSFKAPEQSASNPALTHADIKAVSRRYRGGW
jgi:hypothetical protein